MSQKALQKLWISSHLLYPNSSQAKDIYLQILESEKIYSNPESNLEINSKLNPNLPPVDIVKIQKKLYSFFLKRDPVRSASQFFEFSNLNLVYWKKVIEKCSKEEVFVLILALVCKINFKQIGEVIGIHQNKVKYLLNQSLKKITQNPVMKIDLKKEIKFNKFDEAETSILFINENLIECVLGLAEPSINEKVEQHLIKVTKFNDFKKEILVFKQELESLTISEDYTETLEEYFASKAKANSKSTSYYPSKTILIVSSLIAISVFALVFRPSFVKKIDSEIQIQKITLDEIAFNKQEIKKTEPLASDVAQEITSATVTTVTASASSYVVAVADIKDVNNSSPGKTTKVLPPATNQAADISKPVSSKPKGENGVYRGSISVTDFEQVTSLIKEKVINIGGIKAGEVELGWTKNQKTSYFHFIFPADQKDDLVSFIKQYGNFEFKFEKHPRIIPADHNRFIIEVIRSE